MLHRRGLLSPARNRRLRTYEKGPPREWSVSPTLIESALLSGGEGQRVRLGRALQRKEARFQYFFGVIPAEGDATRDEGPEWSGQ